jgi:hypothetical protein
MVAIRPIYDKEMFHIIRKNWVGVNEKCWRRPPYRGVCSSFAPVDNKMSASLRMVGNIFKFREVRVCLDTNLIRKLIRGTRENLVV